MGIKKPIPADFNTVMLCDQLESITLRITLSMSHGSNEDAFYFMCTYARMY